MRIEITYGEEILVIEIPDNIDTQLLEANDVDIKDEYALIEHALANPIDSPGFEEFIDNGGDFMVIVNDGTRSTPTAKVLSHIEPFFEGKDVRFIVAVGTHRPSTENELKKIFGKYIEKYRKRIQIHDSHDRDNLIKIGVSSRGNELLVNRKVFEADNIIIIGSVEPHYFAGFTGGRKAILPGVAGYDSIKRNHANALDKSSKVYALNGNYLHEEMIYAAQCMPQPIFSIQAVLDREQKIYHINTGDLYNTFDEAVEFSRQIYSAKYSQQFDMVIAEVIAPMDIDLYQAHKAIEHVKSMCKDGGDILLISKCYDGIGPSKFYDILSSGKNSRDLLSQALDDYELGAHKSVKLAQLLERMDIHTYSGISGEMLNSIGINKCDDISKLIEELVEKKGLASIAIVRDASVTVPLYIK